MTFLAVLIIWFIPQSWLAPGVLSLLIGLIQSSAPADWSKSKRWFSWFVLFQSSGVLRQLNHLTELIIPPPEPGKLVQSKVWLDESVVLNRIKVCSLQHSTALFFPLSWLRCTNVQWQTEMVLSGHLSSAQKNLYTKDCEVTLKG